MKLPNAEHAVIDPAKVGDYLLSLTHPIGRSKAKFFARLGYRREEPEELRAALFGLARVEEALPGSPSRYGRKYEVRGILIGRNDSAAVVSVWIILHDEQAPRFVTAYPED